MSVHKIVIVTGASQAIGAGLVKRGEVDTPQDAKNRRNLLQSLGPMDTVTAVQEIFDGLVYLTESLNISGEVLHVDNCAHLGKW